MLVRELFSLDDRRQQAKYLELRINAAHQSKLEPLATLLESHRGGNCSLIISYLHEQNTAKMVPDTRWRINLSEKLLQILREILSPENVIIGYK